MPGSALASDQAYRIADLAIDFCEDVPPLPESQVDRIVSLFREHGAQAKVSSIHVNGWFGAYDKLAMTRQLFAERFGLGLDAANRDWRSGSDRFVDPASPLPRIPSPDTPWVPRPA